MVAPVASDITHALHMRDEIDDASVDVQLPPADSEWQVVQASLRMMDWTGYDIVEYRVQRAGDVWDVYLKAPIATPASSDSLIPQLRMEPPLSRSPWSWNSEPPPNSPGPTVGRALGSSGSRGSIGRLLAGRPTD